MRKSELMKMSKDGLVKLLRSLSQDIKSINVAKQQLHVEEENPYADSSYSRKEIRSRTFRRPKKSI